jgi:hydrogenase 3 maturation protease
MSVDLNKLLKKESGKVLFVGIGNVLRSDDGIGVYISNNIKPSAYISSLTVELSIENYIGKINKLNPDILVLIDCVDLKKESGYYSLLPVEQIRDFTIHTHNISLSRISTLFKMPVLILGIQPKIISFGEGFSAEAEKTANNLIKLINLSSN